MKLTKPEKMSLSALSPCSPYISIKRNAKGLGKLVCHIEGSLYRGSVPYILKDWTGEYHSLCRGIRYIGVRQIEVPLCTGKAIFSDVCAP